MSAIDLNGDMLSHSIAAGKEKGRFAIVGEISASASLGSGVGRTYALTAGVTDGVCGTTSVRVNITVVAVSCSEGVVVTYPSISPPSW